MLRAFLAAVRQMLNFSTQRPSPPARGRSLASFLFYIIDNVVSIDRIQSRLLSGDK